MLSLKETMDSVLAEARQEVSAKSELRPTVQSTTKTASFNLSNDEVKGLVKLASVVRSVNIEPTYEDLYTFVGGLNGRG